MINPDWSHHTASREENPPELSLCPAGVLPSLGLLGQARESALGPIWGWAALPRAPSPAPASSLELGTTSPSPEVRMLLQLCREAAALPCPALPTWVPRNEEEPRAALEPCELWHGDSG